MATDKSPLYKVSVVFELRADSPGHAEQVIRSYLKGKGVNENDNFNGLKEIKSEQIVYN